MLYKRFLRKIKKKTDDCDETGSRVLQNTLQWIYIKQHLRVRDNRINV